MVFLTSSNFATNPTFSLDGQYDRDDLWGYATMSGFTGDRDADFEFDEQVYFTPVPNIGPERLTSTKIRIESSSLEFGNFVTILEEVKLVLLILLQLILINLVFSFLLLKS